MSKRYVLRDGIHEASIPGIGRVRRGEVLTGDYGRFNSQLVEILDSMPSEPAAPARILTEPKLESAPPAKSEPKVLTETLPVEDDVLQENPVAKVKAKKNKARSEQE